MILFIIENCLSFYNFFMQLQYYFKEYFNSFILSTKLLSEIMEFKMQILKNYHHIPTNLLRLV